MVRESYLLDYETGGESVVVAIVEAVAEAEDTDPTALTPALADVIDPEALERILQTSHDGVSVTFGYHGWNIKVHPEGDVTLIDPTDER